MHGINLNLLGLVQYLVISVFLAFHKPSQHQRHSTQALVVLLCAFLSPQPT
jgi:hypothetical protein